MAGPATSNNPLVPILVMVTVVGIVGGFWWFTRDAPTNYGSVGPAMRETPAPREAEADSTSDTIEAVRGQIELVEQRAAETLEENRRLVAEMKQLSEERAQERAEYEARLEGEIERQGVQYDSLGDTLGTQLGELSSAMTQRLAELEARLSEQETDVRAVPIGESAEAAPTYRSGQTVPATETLDIVWVEPLDSPLAGNVDDSEGSGGIERELREGADTITGGRLLRASEGRGGRNDAGRGQRAESSGFVADPNVRTSLAAAHRFEEERREAARAAAIVEPSEEVERVYTLPDLSIGFDSTALTALVGRVYLDEDRVRNPFEFKIVLGRDNIAANYTDLPPEIEGMFFEGLATGDRLLSCVRGTLTAASFIFRDGTVVPAYIGDPGSRPENEAYPANRIGYITDPRGNCVPGQFVSDAPKWLAGTAVLAAAEGYALALRQQHIESASIVDGSGVTVVENFTGEAGEFAAASGLYGGINAVADYARERLGEVFEAVYVPPGQPVVVHLQQELRLDRNPDARQVVYPTQGGSRNARLD